MEKRSTTDLKEIRIATRKSPLALWQAAFVSQLCQKKGFKTKLVPIISKGDQIQDKPLYDIGGKGLFIKELEKALLEGKADLAVHSLKDMAAELSPPFELTAVLKRHSSGDVLIAKDKSSFPELSPSALISKRELKYLDSKKIATGSLRRAHLLRAYTKKIKIFPLRGNVQTRLKKLKESTWDGVILAQASLERLDLASKLIAYPLCPTWFTPSAGQGALAIEMLETHPLRERIQELQCPETRFATDLERNVLHRLGGDCHMPVGVHCQKSEKANLRIRATVLASEKVFTEIEFLTAKTKDPKELGALSLKKLEEKNLKTVLEKLAENKKKKASK